jgi:hypothetical protein
VARDVQHGEVERNNNNNKKKQQNKKKGLEKQERKFGPQRCENESA